jgi:hypothetical protein
MRITKTPTFPVGSTAQRGEEIGVDALSKVVAAAHRAQADAWRSRPLPSAVATPNRASCALPREVEVEARADAALIRGLMRRTAEDNIAIGKALIRQKNSLPHGTFLPWIEAEFDMSERAAHRFTQRIYGATTRPNSVAALSNKDFGEIPEVHR